MIVISDSWTGPFEDRGWRVGAWVNVRLRVRDWITLVINVKGRAVDCLLRDAIPGSRRSREEAGIDNIGLLTN